MVTWMINHSIRIFPPSVKGFDCCRTITSCSIHVASWYGRWLCVVTHAFHMETTVGGLHISFKIVVHSFYTCPSRQVGLQHLRDVYPPRGYLSDSFLPGRRQGMRGEEFRAMFKNTKMGSGQLCFWPHLQSWYSKRFPKRLVSPFHILHLSLQDHVPFQLHLSTDKSYIDVFHGQSTFLEVLCDSLLWNSLFFA